MKNIIERLLKRNLPEIIEIHDSSKDDENKNNDVKYQFS